MEKRHRKRHLYKKRSDQKTNKKDTHTHIYSICGGVSVFNLDICEKKT